MHDVRDLGIREVIRRAIAAVGPGPTYLTVDVDVLDPAFVPGTGTPEPGGMTAVDLLLAVRTVATELDLIGVDVVEVIPTQRRHRRLLGAGGRPRHPRGPDRDRAAPPKLGGLRLLRQLGGRAARAPARPGRGSAG